MDIIATDMVAGYALIGFEPSNERRLEPEAVPPGVTIPLSIIVVEVDGSVLMGHNTWRKQWELPGGLVEIGESHVAAARRELLEETGIQVDNLRRLGRATFLVGSEGRPEMAEVFGVVLPHRPLLNPTDEMTNFTWWPISEACPDDMSPVDAEIARRGRPSRPGE
jgi:8-oxo-dGTP pyrophosphatase MutT (NUDIX family)